MRRIVLILCAGVICLCALWLPTSHRKAEWGGTQTWEVTRYGVFGYHITEKCTGLMGSWMVVGGKAYGLECPQPREERNPTALRLTVLSTVLVVFVCGCALWATRVRGVNSNPQHTPDEQKLP
jgi:hypothetical protein